MQVPKAVSAAVTHYMPGCLSFPAAGVRMLFVLCVMGGWLCRMVCMNAHAWVCVPDSLLMIISPNTRIHRTAGFFHIAIWPPSSSSHGKWQRSCHGLSLPISRSKWCCIEVPRSRVVMDCFCIEVSPRLVQFHELHQLPFVQCTEMHLVLHIAFCWPLSNEHAVVGLLSTYFSCNAWEQGIAFRCSWLTSSMMQFGHGGLQRSSKLL